MNTDAIAGTATLKNTDAGIEVGFEGETLAVIADGSTLIKRAERVLRSHRVLRAEGYRLEAGTFVAGAVRVIG